MKKRQPIYTWLLSLLALCATLACDPAINTDHAKVGEAVKSLQSLPFEETYRIDTSKSQLSWIGTKVTGHHNGVIPVQHGEVQLQGNLVVGGNIMMDMQALKATDKRIDEADNKKLSKHLKSIDFFDVARFPTATFELISIKPLEGNTQPEARGGSALEEELRVKDPTHYITGNLTIKAKTRSVTFPARVTIVGNELKVQANFNIDRTHWGLTYGSDKSLGNKTIHPIVNIGLDVVAKP